MNKRPKFTFFDGIEEEFALKVTSHNNIKEVCAVMVGSSHLDQNERIYYAELGEVVKPVKDGDGNLVYRFENIYDNSTMWDGLAQALVYDDLELIEVKEDGEAVIIDTELHGKLIRREVKEAFDFFLGEFSAIPYEVERLLGLQKGVQNMRISAMKTVMEKMRAQESIAKVTSKEPDTSQPLEIGKAKS